MGFVRVVWCGMLPVIALLALGAAPVFLWSEGYIGMWSADGGSTSITDRAVTREIRAPSPDGRADLVFFGFEGDTEGTLAVVAKGAVLDPEAYWDGPSFYWPETAATWRELPLRIDWADNDHVVIRYCGFGLHSWNAIENPFRPIDLSMVREDGCLSTVNGPAAVVNIVPEASF